MGLPVGEVQAAVIVRLRGDMTLQGLLTGAASPLWSIYDAGGVPVNTPFPYLVIQEITGVQGTAWTTGTDAADVFTQVSIFTQAGTGAFKATRGIAKQADHLLHGPGGAAPLTLANGFTAIATIRDNYQELPESDGITQHIALRYKSWIQG